MLARYAAIVVAVALTWALATWIFLLIARAFTPD